MGHSGPVNRLVYFPNVFKGHGNKQKNKVRDPLQVANSKKKLAGFCFVHAANVAEIRGVLGRKLQIFKTF